MTGFDHGADWLPFEPRLTVAGERKGQPASSTYEEQSLHQAEKERITKEVRAIAERLLELANGDLTFIEKVKPFKNWSFTGEVKTHYQISLHEGKVLGRLAFLAYRGPEKNVEQCRLVMSQRGRFKNVFDELFDLQKELWKENAVKDNRSSSAWIDLAARFVDCCHFDRARNMINEMPQMPEKEELLNKIAHYFLRCEELKEASGIARELSDGYWQGALLRDIVTAYLKEEKVDEAERRAFQIRDPEFQSAALLDLVICLTEGGEVERALKVISSIKNAPERFGAIIEIAPELIKAGKKERLFALLKGGDEQLFCAVSHLFAEAGDVEGVLSAAQGIQRAKRREYVTVSALSYLIAKALERGELEKALKVAREKLAGDVRAEELSIIAIWLIQKRGEVEESLKIAKEMNGKLPRLRVLSAAVQRLLQEEKFDEALSVAGSIRGSERVRFASKAVHALGLALIKKGRYRQALKLTPALSSLYREDLIYHAALTLGEEKKVERMWEVGATLTNALYKMRVQTYAAELFYQRGEIDRSLAALKGLSDRMKRAQLKELATLAKRGEKEEVARRFEEAMPPAPIDLT